MTLEAQLVTSNKIGDVKLARNPLDHKKLKQLYENAMRRLNAESGIKTVVFASFGTGVGWYNAKVAPTIAMCVFRDFFIRFPDREIQVIIACVDVNVYQAFNEAKLSILEAMCSETDFYDIVVQQSKETYSTALATALMVNLQYISFMEFVSFLKDIVV